ncbi:MAG: restriction endonuclease subunit S [Dolichospermum sp. JUN01]|nr:restriction endonuclease subunit S [Dolichospermum sp. JUN01]
MELIVDSRRLPVGWEIKTIGEVCKSGAGGTPLKSKKEYYEGGQIPWLLSGEVAQGEIFKSENFITQRGLENSSAKIFPVNTVLVAMYGATAGQVGILRFETATNQAVCGILPNERFIPEFIYYVLLSKKAELISKAAGNAQPNISQIKIKNTEIPVPPLPEQKRIVAIADEAFEGIDRAIRNTEKNLSNARELFESYLNTIFTQKGDGWEEKTLHEISTQFSRGKSKHRPRNDKKLYDGQYPFIQTGDIRNSNHIVNKYSQTYNEVGLAQSKLWTKGTVCITIAANIAETGVLDFAACIPDSIIGLVVDQNKANNMFVEYMLQAFKFILKAKGQGSAQDNINMGTFESQTFPFPLIDEQEKIVEKLDFLSTETQRLEIIYRQKIAALKELKQSILQKAFTGELTADKGEK